MDAALQDKKFGWHPFTQQSDWEADEPLIIERAEGVWLFDTEGRKYFDGNSSIWTNIHGHCRPEIVEAISKQASRLDHSSYLGLGHSLASELAAQLIGLFPDDSLKRVFFSDNGSSAVEVALKMSLQSRIQTGQAERKRFVAFTNGYHGDTLGAASVGGVERFFDRFRSSGFPVDFVGGMEELETLDCSEICAVIIEPLIQGVNQMTPWPNGMLRELRGWTEKHHIHLICDEVMTGFGRTGRMFACEWEDVVPDFLCLAKGLTGGTVPLAATLTTKKVYDAFLGGPDRVFSYGHSYTGNPIGCAAALASLDIFRKDKVIEGLAAKISRFEELLEQIKDEFQNVSEVRSCGLIAGVELERGMGKAAVAALLKEKVITRNILDTIVIMPPLVVSLQEMELLFGALRRVLLQLSVVGEGKAAML